jgi:hypothetical protein
MVEPRGLEPLSRWGGWDRPEPGRMTLSPGRTFTTSLGVSRPFWPSFVPDLCPMIIGSGVRCGGCQLCCHPRIGARPSPSAGVKGGRRPSACRRTNAWLTPVPAASRGAARQRSPRLQWRPGHPAVVAAVTTAKIKRTQRSLPVRPALRPEHGHGASWTVDGCRVVYGRAARDRASTARRARRAALLLHSTAARRAASAGVVSCPPSLRPFPSSRPNTRAEWAGSVVAAGHRVAR